MKDDKKGLIYDDAGNVLVPAEIVRYFVRCNAGADRDKSNRRG